MTSGAEADDARREASAYNNSIYLMVGVPYLLLGGFSYVVYRGLKRQALTNELLYGQPTEEPHP